MISSGREVLRFAATAGGAQAIVFGGVPVGQVSEMYRTWLIAAAAVTLKE
jgi:hypothetical protein